MATSASSQRPSSSVGPSATWARSGEPGSAFGGLSRGRGRGNGRGRGGRGGRGGGKETKPIGAESSGDKANTTSKNAPTPVTKPVALPPPATSVTPPAPTTALASGRHKGANSRRASRTIPTVAVPQPNAATDVPGSPSTSRSQNNRRRRSQSSKPASTNLPKINVPSRDDNLPRPQRLRMGQAPHSAPIKDAPPHLPGGSFDMRSNIDALVERVRAVAMAENRPSTPGSHIDWAGDDDDSLPDLDDWGVTTAVGPAEKAELISPIVVDGLKPLPDVTIEPQVSPPPPQSPELAKEPTPNGVLESRGLKGPPEPTTQPSVTASDVSDLDEVHVATPVTTTQQPLTSAPAIAKVSLHPSLPPKPVVRADMSSILLNSRQGPGATSMREHSITSPLVVTDKPAPVSDPLSAEPAVSASEPAVMVERTRSEQGLSESVHAPPAQDTNREDPFANLSSRGGLTTSIHAPAPSGILETKSAPSNISSYSSTTCEHRTHTRAHTVGRPPSFPRPEFGGRPSRSGYSTPRGGHSAGYHSRTHSTPPAGLHSQRSPNTHRPVITGDAISRLARTIGNTTVSPGRTATATTTTHD
ncbi:hypothetical protein LshimejAT787_0104860 [Lyophyllum shimeji]|uniref:Uncharacterized protein n=1 Tax=Lyophyllum shimeji TaxID=47721 RepID=A0A9P3PDR2_LYOSH|nr:hypothetical protein LshimejAT787_0104860 [Lyophyllum shimeji]